VQNHTVSKVTLPEWFREVKRTPSVPSEYMPIRRTLLSSQKTLLLGAGEQGKRTFTCACDHLVNRTYDNEEPRRQWTSSLQHNITNVLQQIPSIIEMNGLSLDFKPENQSFIDGLKSAKSFDQNFWRRSCELLQDPAMNQLIRFEHFQKLQIMDHLFFEVLPRLGSFSALFTNGQTFIPEFEDVLRTRMRVTGVTEYRLRLDGVSTSMFLVGGQRNERKKWIHCFEGVTNILFFISMDDFGKTLFEDSQTSRMLENLNLFESIVGTAFFPGLDGINVVLTRADMMRRKIQDGFFPGVDDHTGMEFGFKLNPSVRNRADPQEIENEWVEFIQKKVKTIGRNHGKRVRILGPTNQFEPSNCLESLKTSLKPFSEEDELIHLPMPFKAGLLGYSLRIR
jgi:hypothetical protein